MKARIKVRASRVRTGSSARGWLPANPIGRQQRQPDGDEMLLEIKETERLPMAGALQIGPDVDAEVQVDGSAEQRGNHIQNDDGIGV